MSKVEKALNDCIIACETCTSECLKMGANDCVSNCIVTERVCKALKVSMKNSCNKALTNPLVRASKEACKNCVKSCSEHSDMKCCRDCSNKASKLMEML